MVAEGLGFTHAPKNILGMGELRATLIYVGAFQNVAHLRGGPVTTTRGRHLAGGQLGGNGAECYCAGCLNFADDRQHPGGVLGCIL